MTEYERIREKACHELHISPAVFDELVTIQEVIGSALWADLTDEEKDALIVTTVRLAKDGHE